MSSLRPSTMRTALHLAAAVAVVLTAAACGTSSTSGGGSTDNGAEPPTRATSSPLSSPPSSGAPAAMQPNQAKPDARATRLRTLRWDRAEASGSELKIHYTTTGSAACSTLGRVQVIETETAVTVTLLVGNLPEAACGGATAQVAAPYVTTVALQSALGSRQVRDGASA
jgi:hypothetical protein